MPIRSGALILFRLSFACLIVALAPAVHAAQAEFLSRHVWTSQAPEHGGFSGLEVSSDGARFVAVSDRGHIARGVLVREGDGIVGTRDVVLARLTDPRGRPLAPLVPGDARSFQDAEGLALAGDGGLFVSFEGHARIWRYDGAFDDAALAAAVAVPGSPDFDELQLNSGLEALAIGDDGALYTLPERSGRLSRPFPLFRHDRDGWRVAQRIPRRGDFLPVGADIGPDGLFYLLERKFAGLLGFSLRIRRFDLGAELAEETLLSTGFMQHGNLEGLSVWRDGAGAIRLTMIEDDNFSRFQRTQFVEYRVTE